MEKIKLILIVLLFLLVPTVLADGYKIELKPHYFIDEFLTYANDSYNGISFEIIGINSFSKSRILNITILDASPQVFKDALSNNTESLRILQEKELWMSKVMDTNDFIEGNVDFWIEVSGINEKTNEIIIMEDSTSLFVKEFNKAGDPLLLSIGNSIWEDNPSGGIGILICLGFVCFFMLWKYKAGDKMDGWRDVSEKKRLERRQWEEGF